MKDMLRIFVLHSNGTWTVDHPRLSDVQTPPEVVEKKELDQVLDVLYQMQHTANWTFSPKSKLVERAEAILRKYKRLK
jgi:hypothetical protein